MASLHTDVRPEDRALLAELAPVAESLLERHLAASKPWYSHEIIPWSLGRDFVPGEAWSPDDVKLPDPVRSALFVNLLTEDNLPYYFETINRMFGRNDIWATWSHRWTAEEARHSIAIRDFLVVTRAIDPWALEDARIGQMSGGEVPQPETACDGFVYVALQELATRISHRNTGKLLQTEMEASGHSAARAGYDVMARVAADENFHYLFYRDITSAALKVDPSSVVCAIDRQIADFEMPGTGIAGFAEHSRAIATAGIYNLPIHYSQILAPVVLRHWGLESIEGLNDEAEQARDRTLKLMARLERASGRMAERADRRAARAVEQGGVSTALDLRDSDTELATV
jgi:acyl-[acyl-carrier-protein] desaturase